MVVASISATLSPTLVSPGVVAMIVVNAPTRRLSESPFHLDVCIYQSVL
jgi:hypothetical protein